MDESTIREKLSRIKCFMLDMDGTFYLGANLLDGSLDFLEKLRETGRTNLFLTNNSSKSAEVYRQKLARMGVAERYRNVLTSGQAAGSWCLREMPGKKAFLLGNDMLRAELEQMGVAIDNAHPDYVLIAYDTTLDYAKMTAVCDFVRAGSVQLRSPMVTVWLPSAFSVTSTVRVCPFGVCSPVFVFSGCVVAVGVSMVGSPIVESTISPPA